MDPILERKVFHPPVGCSAVVGHHIHYHLQSLLMSLLHILLIEFVRTHTRVNMIIVCAGIAVI